MKLFQEREIREAYAHAAEGGQALHVCDTKRLGVDLMPNAPSVFKRSTRFAHLFDQDLPRLVETARRLGVRVVRPHHPGTHRQHVDLCGAPLDRAIAESAPGVEQGQLALG